MNATEAFVDDNVRAGRGDSVAITDAARDREMTYRDVLAQVNRTGHALRRLGIRPEERVMLLLPDVPEFAFAFFGAIKIGAVAVPVNTLLKPHDYEYLLNDTRARIAIVSETLLSQWQQIPREKLRYLETIVLIGEPASGFLTVRELLEAASPDLKAEPTSKDDPAFWLYSSGSTATPKGCVHLHHDMVVCSELYAKGILRISEHDRCYSVAKLFFAYGLGNAGYFPL